MAAQEKTGTKENAAFVFSLVYDSFEKGVGSPVLRLATIKKPPLTDVLVVEDLVSGTIARSTQSDFDPIRAEIYAGLDTFFDKVIPGGSAHVHEVTRGKLVKSRHELYFDENTYRIPTNNPGIELVIVNQTDDRSHSWGFRMERKPESLGQRILGALKPIFDHNMLPPDRL